jgi:mercuric ion transport protein
MSSRVELIYDSDCPNADEARSLLRRAFGLTGLPAQWTEWNRQDSDAPPDARCYGSPTILVDGRDVVGMAAQESADSCRLYVHDEGFRGVPPLDRITAAIRKTNSTDARRRVATFGWRRFLAALPTSGAALLPVGICPACWPAYAGLLSSIGLGFLLENRYVLALLAVLLTASLVTLAYRAKTRRGYAPFGLGVLATGMILTSKFLFAFNPLLYGGVVLLVAASIWNAWPRRAARKDSYSCSACTPDHSATTTPPL